MSRDEAVYIISVAAERAGVHPQTLRIYERRGLLSPYRTPGGTRRYSEKDLARLRAIQALTAAGINLEGVKRILQLEGAVEALQRQLDQIKAQLETAKAEATESFSSLPDILRPTIQELLEES
ncbi:MAG: helix-turn-helix transcriptional regulator [Acidimicrobiia bacterium]|nr:helix-turn-helix transcriptional regulator [Acidimicrobiia bacterium]